MKRDKRKPIKLSNIDLVESLFNEIEKELGYHITRKNYKNSYFVYETENEDDTIVHFKIKEIPGFTFALWNTCWFEKPYSNLDGLVRDTSELIFFTQYDITLDKFKPSQSGYVLGLERMVNDDKTEYWYLYSLKQVLNYMKKHPIKAAYYSFLQVPTIMFEASDLYILKSFISDWYYYFKDKIKDKLEYRKSIRICKTFIRKIKNIKGCKAYVTDLGPCWHSRFNIFLYDDSRLLSKKEDRLLNKLYFKILHKYDSLINIYYRDELDKYTKGLEGAKEVDGDEDFKLLFVKE